MQKIEKYIDPVGRTLLAVIFIVSGFGKIGAYAGTQGYMESMGVPGALLPVVIAVEILGGFAVMLGWKTKIAAFLLAGFTMVSAILFHFDLADQIQMINFMKNAAITGGFLLLVKYGAGSFSFDNRSLAKEQETLSHQ